VPPPFHFLLTQKEEGGVGLGTLVRQRETVCLHGTFPTEWPGSEQEVHAEAKTLVVDNAPCPACWARTGHLSIAPMHRTVKPKQRTGFGMLSCGRVQMQASDF